MTSTSKIAAITTLFLIALAVDLVACTQHAVNPQWECHQGSIDAATPKYRNILHIEKTCWCSASSLPNSHADSVLKTLLVEAPGSEQSIRIPIPETYSCDALFYLMTHLVDQQDDSTAARNPRTVSETLHLTDFLLEKDIVDTLTEQLGHVINQIVQSSDREVDLKFMDKLLMQRQPLPFVSWILPHVTQESFEALQRAYPTIDWDTLLPNSQVFRDYGHAESLQGAVSFDIDELEGYPFFTWGYCLEHADNRVLLSSEVRELWNRKLLSGRGHWLMERVLNEFGGGAWQEAKSAYEEAKTLEFEPYPIFNPNAEREWEARHGRKKFVPPEFAHIDPF